MHMGWISAWKGTNAYEAALKSCGVNPYSLPADLNGRICSYANQQYERSHPIVKRTMSLEEFIGQAGTLVALCVLGPTVYANRGASNGVTMDHTAANAARHWRESGPDSSLESKIIETVSNAGVMHSEFANAFNAML